MPAQYTDREGGMYGHTKHGQSKRSTRKGDLTQSKLKGEREMSTSAKRGYASAKHSKTQAQKGDVSTQSAKEASTATATTPSTIHVQIGFNIP